MGSDGRRQVPVRFPGVVNRPDCGGPLLTSGGSRVPTHFRRAGKRHNAAVICVARRRCNIILAMLNTQTPYQPREPQNLPDAA